MCGIGGLIRFDGGAADLGVLAGMGRALSHRGPDGSGEWAEAAIGLCHRRLSIRDLSDAGLQPIFSDGERFAMVFNGEIYNCEAIRRRLERETGIVFRTSGDADLIANVFRADGPAGLGALNGMYAFAVADRRTGTLWLGRDPVGIKPLYILQPPGGRYLAFASETKAFRPLANDAARVDPHSFLTLLAQGHVGPRNSIMAGARSLAPGELMRIDADGTVGTSQIRFRSDGGADRFDPSNAGDLRRAFEAALDRQRVSDRPLAVWQSGGIDSTLISAACRSPRPELISVRFREADFDESAAAASVASHLGATLRLIDVEDPQDPAAEFASIVHHLDGEIADSSALAVGRLAAATRPHATVVLSGDGADETFGGYPTYAASALAARVGAVVPTALAHPLARLAFRAAGGATDRYPVFDRVGRLLQGLPRGRTAHAEWRRYAMPWTLRSLLGSALRPLAEWDPLSDYRAGGDGAGPSAAERALAADFSYYLPSDLLVKTDRMSMMHSVEVRTPFLDLEFLEAVRRIPAARRLPARGRTKPLLRDLAAEAYGIDAALSRRPKTGFNVPVASLLRGRFREVMQTLLMREDHVSPYLDAGATRRLVGDHLSGRGNHGYVLWTLMTFAEWRRSTGAR